MKKTGKIIFFGTLLGLLCSFGNAQTVQAQDEIAIEDGVDRKSTRLNSSHRSQSRMPSSA